MDREHIDGRVSFIYFKIDKLILPLNSMDIPDLLEASDLSHRGGTYTVGFVERRAVQLFRAFIAANPDSELRYQREDRQNLRGRVLLDIF